MPNKFLPRSKISVSGGTFSAAVDSLSLPVTSVPLSFARSPDGGLAATNVSFGVDRREEGGFVAGVRFVAIALVVAASFVDAVTDAGFVAVKRLVVPDTATRTPGEIAAVAPGSIDVKTTPPIAARPQRSGTL